MDPHEICRNWKMTTATGTEQKGPLNVSVLVGRRRARGNIGKKKETQLKNKKNTPKKTGEKISTQPYPQ